MSALHTGAAAPSGVLTRDRILDAAEEVLRRHGPGKAMVVDVARLLRVSHGSVYRHFPSKQALGEAVVERWLDRVSAPLGDLVASSDQLADDALRSWLHALCDIKQGKARDDPELFEAYHLLAQETRSVVAAHLDRLADQLAAIITAGVRTGVFEHLDPPLAGRAILHATARFHHPAHRSDWSRASTAELDHVIGLLLGGLRAA